MRNDSKYLNIHKKATHQEYILYISKHQLAFQCHFLCHVLCPFCWISVKIMAPGMGFQHDFSATEMGISHCLCAWGWGISRLKKFLGVGLEGMVRLGID